MLNEKDHVTVMLWKKGFKVLEIRLLKDWSFDKRGHLKRNDQFLKQKYLLRVLMENCLWGRKCESGPITFYPVGLGENPNPSLTHSFWKGHHTFPDLRKNE